VYSYLCRARGRQFRARFRRRANGTAFGSFVEITWTLIIVLAVFVSFPIVCNAQFASTYRANTVDYNVTGRLFAGGSTPSGPLGYKNISGRDSVQTGGFRPDPDVVVGPASVKATIGDTHGSDKIMTEASISLEATADFGALRVNVHGYADVLSKSQLGEAVASARVQARWQDTLKLENNINPMPGRLHHMKAFLRLDGGIDIHVEGDAPFQPNGREAASAVHLKLLATSPIGQDALPPPPYSGVYFAEGSESTSMTVGVKRPADRIIPVNIFAREDEYFVMDFLMEVIVGGRADISNYYATLGNHFSTTFSGDFGHTLSWGGITSVEDAATGEQIEGWSITSSSGVNYANAVVPEPATVGLALLGLLALTCRRARATPGDHTAAT
jgi:hypothetical protein